MTRYVTATLVKRTTADGLVEVKDEVPLGTTYRVDLDSRLEVELFHKGSGTVHKKLWIWTDDDTTGGLPVEMLDISDQ